MKVPRLRSKVRTRATAKSRRKLSTPTIPDDIIRGGIAPYLSIIEDYPSVIQAHPYFSRILRQEDFGVPHPLLRNKYVVQFIQRILDQEYPPDEAPPFINYPAFRAYFFQKVADYLQGVNPRDYVRPRFPEIAYASVTHHEKLDNHHHLPSLEFPTNYYPDLPEKVKMAIDPSYRPTKEDFMHNHGYFGFYIQEGETPEEVTAFFGRDDDDFEEGDR